MKRWSLVLVLLLAGCSLQQPPFVTVKGEHPVTASPAVTPSQTATTSPTPVPTASPTDAPTAPSSSTSVAATATRTVTAQATATARAQAAEWTLCNQQFGPADAPRFSARLLSIEIRNFPQWDQISFIFAGLKGDIHGEAACMERVQWEQRTTDDALADDLLTLDFPDWAHDLAFAQSPITETLAITASTVLTGVAFAPRPDASRGLLIGIGLRGPLPYHVLTSTNPDRLIVEVRRDGKPLEANDPLVQPGGDLDLPDQPIFFLQNNDVWRWYRGQAAPIVKTDEIEFGLAVSPDRATLAVCRAPAGTDPASLPYDVHASLWVLQADGSHARNLADGGGCAEPRFSPNGKSVAFTANVAGFAPRRLMVFTVPLVVGALQPATTAIDEWDRFDPHWLPDGRLVYRARDASGQTILLIHSTDGHEHELSAALLAGSKYVGVGNVVVNDADGSLAVEAYRSDQGGSDLVILRPDGTQAGADGRGYWQRPLAWSTAGLLYLTVECPSGVFEQWTLRQRRETSTDDLLSGAGSAGLGDVVIHDGHVVYSRVQVPQPGLRGPQPTPVANTPVSMWEMSLDATMRREMYRAPVAIAALQP